MIDKKRITPFIITPIVIIIDQITKMLVVKNIELYSIPFALFDDFFWLTHVRNPGSLFGLFQGLNGVARTLLLILLPIVFLVWLIFYLFKTDEEITTSQRWAFGVIIGGGIGNIIDRVFRIEGVVDFLSVKFYGIFGLDRWPTFNVADMSIVIGGVFLIITTLLSSSAQKKGKNDKRG